MSCNGCRVLRKGCNDNCVLRPCLQWIESADAQGNATVFVAKFFGRAGLMGFIGAVPEDQRAALFQSLLYEACGRTVNPVHGALGLLWSGKWSACEAAVETVLKGGSLKAPAAGGGGSGLGLGLGLGGSGSLAPGAGAAQGVGAGGTFPLPRHLPPQAPPLERGGSNVNPGPGVMPAMASRPSSCRARSSFTGHLQHSAQSQSQEEVRQQGRLAVGLAAAAVRAAAHEVDNASEISSAGTGRLVEERTGVGEEMKLREMLLRGHEWSSGRPRAVNLAGDGDGDGGAKENADAGRRTWQQSVKPAPAVVSSSLPYTLWCGVQNEHSGSGRVVETRVKRELEDDDVRMGNQVMSPLARRVQPRLELYSNSASAQPDLQWQQRPAAGAWDRCEVDASSREMDAKPLPAAAAAAACAVELNLALNTYSLGKCKEQQQQQRKTCPGQAAGGAGRVSSPSCGSVNSEGSVTSLDSSKSAVSVSPWTLQLASALQSNRQLLPLLR